MRKLSLILLLFVFGSMSLTAQEKSAKLVKAETNFCNSLKTFVATLDDFDKIDENSTMDEFRTAYKNVEKAWKKVQKTAAKLEKVEIKESLAAYNKLVNAVNKIDGEATTGDATAAINQHIDATVAEIAEIMNLTCK